MRNFILGILATGLIGGLIIGAFIFGQKSNSSAQPEPKPTITITGTPTPTPLPTPNEATLIRSALFKENNWPQDLELTVNIKTNDGKYVSGTVSSRGGGGYFYAEKVNGNWEIVADGNGMVFCNQLEKYPDFPKTLIPECYDQKTGKNIDR